MKRISIFLLSLLICFDSFSAEIPIVISGGLIATTSVIGTPLAPLIIPLAGISFLGYKFGKLFFAKHTDKKLKQKNRNNENI